MNIDLAPIVDVFDDRLCVLGESPLWHPTRQELFWVDLPNNTVFSNKFGVQREWKFDEIVSAIAWIDHDNLLLAMETGLMTLSLIDGRKNIIAVLEKDTPQNRSNDGRADPWGGFWVGTMHKDALPEMGAIYRFYQGEVRPLIEGISIPNAICFNHSESLAYYADSATGKVNQIQLDETTGWPISEPRMFIDVSAECGDPDGAVIDRLGNMWIAMWDSFEVRKYSIDGLLLKKIHVGTQRPTCPAFIAEDASRLVVTTAAYGMGESDSSTETDGATLVVDEWVDGVLEPAVKL